MTVCSICKGTGQPKGASPSSTLVCCYCHGSGVVTPVNPVKRHGHACRCFKCEVL